MWLVHLGWITVLLAITDARYWRSLPGLWRWVVLGVLAYSLVTTPFTIWRVLQAYWNAADAARANRELASRSA